MGANSSQRAAQRQQFGAERLNRIGSLFTTAGGDQPIGAIDELPAGGGNQAATSSM